MKHLDLFSGIGGFALACQWAGIETIGFVEIDKYCQKVLRKHWPDVPIVEDIRDVERIKGIAKNAMCERCTPQCGTRQTTARGAHGLPGQSDNDTPAREQGNGDHPALLATAGFPCQPFSVAGKREGERDDRYLWPQTITVIEAIKPRWILLENVTGIINLALDTVLSDLEGAGYSYETLVIPACAVNAPHRRDRIWIVAHAMWGREEPWPKRWASNESGEAGIVAHAKSPGDARGPTEIRRPKCGQGASLPTESIEPGIIPDTTGKGLQRQRTEHKLREISTEAEIAGCDWWAVEPELGRVANGVPHRVDRLKCLGNAIVPPVAYEIIRVIVRVNWL